MKLYLTLILIFSLTLSQKTLSQITLDTEFEPIGLGFDFYTVQISKDETKYLISDTTTNTFDLLNMDFTPFLEGVEVPEPFAITSSAPMQALYVTRTLFDCDSSNIEYAYYSTTNSTKPFKVLRTDGTVLFELDSAFGPFCWGGCLGLSDVVVPIRNTSDGAKLFLYHQNKISIYSLCGELPNEVFDFSNLNETAVSVFPNPTTGMVSITLNTNSNIRPVRVRVYNDSGKEISNVENLTGLGRIDLNLSELSSGVYHYKMEMDNDSSKSGKFLIIK